MSFPFTPQTFPQEIRAVVDQRIASQWVDPDGNALTPIAWEGVVFEPPTDSSWLKVNLLFGDSFSSTYSGDGNGTNLNVGVIQLQVYAPKGNGPALLDALIGKARSIFSRYSGNGLICQASGELFAGSDGGWLYRTVRTIFYSHEQIGVSA